jgi:hypothetical protein
LRANPSWVASFAQCAPVFKTFKPLGLGQIMLSINKVVSFAEMRWWLSVLGILKAGPACQAFLPVPLNLGEIGSDPIGSELIDDVGFADVHCNVHRSSTWTQFAAYTQAPCPAHIY